MNDSLLMPLYLRLSERKHEIVELACYGLSNDDIAGSLVIASSTVATHLTEIYDEMATCELFAHTKPNRLILISAFAPFYERHPLMRNPSLAARR